MAPLTKGRMTPERSGTIRELPVKGATKLYAGALAALSGGLLVPMAAALGLRGVGRVEAETDNTAGADGAINARVSAGIHQYANSAGADAITAADIGRECYGVDDQTVAKTDGNRTRSVAGIVFDVDSRGVWVDFTDGRAGTQYERATIPTLVGTDTTRIIAASAGKISRITSVLQKALTTGNAVITVSINGVAVTTGVLTHVQATAVAGDTVSVDPTANNVVKPGDVIGFAVSGTNASAVLANLLLDIVR